MEEIKNHVIARIIGGKEFKQFLLGKRLTRAQAMKAKCYECNGEADSGADCAVDTCPLYRYHPHRERRAPQMKGTGK